MTLRAGPRTLLAALAVSALAFVSSPALAQYDDGGGYGGGGGYHGDGYGGGGGHDYQPSYRKRSYNNYEKQCYYKRVLYYDDYNRPHYRRVRYCR